MDRIRETFERELKEVEDMVMAMGLTVMEMLKKSMIAYKKEDNKLVDDVIKMDDIVDKYNIDIERRCLELIATQQPMARDLRFIASTMRIISDIERMGDYTVDVVKFARRLFGFPKVSAQATVHHMAELTGMMLQEALDAISRKDLNLIAKMIEDDDKVDSALKKVFDEVLSDIEKDPKTARGGIYLILMARYIERIADHITNVGERTHYMETGEMKELHIS
ncbi:phosphate signaling complex protein PhoU [Candidatus Saganbacteria bacterium]|nr:phosphate signaling complex protein PhoU [Candidatus Saganbacteria bacterium]